MIWLALPALVAASYYLLAFGAALFWRRSARPAVGAPRGVSVLKPVHGRDPRFHEAIRSHASQDYPEFEILFGVSDPNDAALEDIALLQREFPSVPIAAYTVQTSDPNVKTGVLAELSRHARHPLLLVNDSDILVQPDYLRSVAAPLDDPAIGMVTCLYRAHAESRAARAEALGIATEFAPSVMVARLLGLANFALGSTMCFRADDLRAMGGFEAIAGYLADDYQLGLHIARLGRRIEFSPVVVQTNLGAGSWRSIWMHQLRWSRTIRVSRPSGYFGYAVTHATVWALVAFAAGEWWAGVIALSARLLAGVVVGAGILRDREVLAAWWMIPLRDLFGFAVWLGGLFGDEVHWRGQSLKLRRDGKIERQRVAM